MESAIRCGIAASVLGILGLASAAQASLIPEISGKFSYGTTVGATAPAGVVPQTGDWNTFNVATNNSGSVGNGGSIANSTVIDNSGATVGAQASGGSGVGIAWTAGYAESSSGNPGYTTASGFTPEDVHLFTSFMANTGGTNKTVTVTITNLPSAYSTAGYNVYEYFYDYTTTTPDTIHDSGTGDTFYVSSASTALGYNSYTGVTESNPGTNTAEGGIPSNYAEFNEPAGSTGTEITFTFTSDVSQIGVYGLQIVAAPEPASLGLLSVATLGLLARRRRAEQKTVL